MFRKVFAEERRVFERFIVSEASPVFPGKVQQRKLKRFLKGCKARFSAA